MRKFCMVSPKIWTDYIRRFPDDVKTVYLYLWTSRHQTLAGGCYLPLDYAASDTGWDELRVQHAVQWLRENGYIVWDAETEEIFVSDWFSVNFPSSSKTYKGAAREIDGWNSVHMKRAAFNSLHEEENRRGRPSWMSEVEGHMFPSPEEALENLQDEAP